MTRTEGIVIRRSDFSQTSQVVEFYTVGHGRVPTLAKGIRRKNARFEGPVDLFYLCDIVYAPRQRDALAPLVECKVLDWMGGISKRLASLCAASYVVQLVQAVTVPEQANEALFGALLKTLSGLADNKNASLCVDRFELKALEAEGLAPNLNGCVSCGSRLRPGRPAFFSVELGGVLCEGCSDKVERKEPLDARTAGVLRTFASTRWPAVDNLRIPRQVHLELRRIMDSLFAYHFGRRPRSLALFERAVGIAARRGIERAQAGSRQVDRNTHDENKTGRRTFP